MKVWRGPQQHLRTEESHASFWDILPFFKLVQWDQFSPGNFASHYLDRSIIKLDFLAA